MGTRGASDLIASVVRNHWPFHEAREEAKHWNSHFGLNGPRAFSEDLNPVWWVGQAAREPRFLGVGINPRRNTDHKWSLEVAEIQTSNVDEYLENRANYFLRKGFNGTHYVRTARLLAAYAGLREPGDSESARYFLHDHFLQVELVPFFSEEFGLSEDGLDEMRGASEACLVADQILGETLHLPWDCIVVRGLKSAWPTVLKRFGVDEVGGKHLVGGFAFVDVAGSRTALIGITNNRCSTDAIRELAHRARRG